VATDGKARRPLIAFAALLAAGFGVVIVYYVSFRQAQERNFADRKLRALGVLAEQVEGRLAGLGSSVRNLLEESRKRGGSVDVYLKQGVKLIRPLKLMSADQSLDLADFDHGAATNGADELWDMEAIPDARSLPQTALLASPLDSDGARGVTFGTDYALQFDLKGTDRRTPFAKTRMSALLGPLLEGSALEGLDVFVAKQDGEIIFQTGGSAVRLASIGETTSDHPMKTDRRAAIDTEGKNKGERENGGEQKAAESRAEGQEPKVPCSLPDLQRLRASASVAKCRFESSGDSSPEYTIFTQPLRAPGDQTWIVGALVRSDQIKKQASALSAGILEGMGLALLLTLLALPGIKFLTLGARGRLTRLDVHLLAGSFIGLTALAVMGFFHARMFVTLRDSLDREMQEAGESITAEFGKEISPALELLEEFGRCRARLMPRDQSVTGRVAVPHLIPRSWRVGLICGSILDSTIENRLEEYPYYRMFFVVDEDGRQLEKWTIDRATTPFTPVSDYAFFAAVSEHKSFFRDLGGAPRRYSLSVVLSPNTGERLTMLSLPMENAPGKSVVMATRMLSLAQPLVPPGLEFAVIEPSGRVVFHAADSRSLYTNLFDEAGDSSGLEELIKASRSGFNNLAYDGHPTRAYVQPLSGTPWSIVLLRDEETLRSAVFETAIAASNLFLAYTLLYLVIVSLVPVFRPHDWLWPQVARPGLYAACLGVLLLLAAWYFWVIWHGGTGARVLMAAPVTAFTLCFLYVRLSTPLSGEFVSSSRRRRLWIARGMLVVLGVFVLTAGSVDGTSTIGGVAVFLAALCGLLFKARKRQHRRLLGVSYAGVMLATMVIVGLIPALSFELDASEQAVEAFVRLRLRRFAEDFERREQAIRRDFENLDEALLLIKSRECECADVATSSQLSIEPPRCPGDPPMDHPRCWAIARASKVVEPPVAIDSWELKLVNWLLSCREESSRDRCILAARHLSGLIMEALPAFEEESHRLRAFLYPASSDGRWDSWIDRDSRPWKETLRLFDPRVRAPWNDNVRKDDTFVEMVMPTASPPGLAKLILLAAVVLALVWGVARLLRRVCDLLFGLQVDDVDHVSDAKPASFRGNYLLRPPGEEIARVEKNAHIVDWLEIGDPFEDPKLPVSSERAIVVKHMEHRLDERERNVAKLELLERVVLRRSNPVTVISQTDPISYFAKRLKSEGDPACPANYVTGEEMERWSRVFEQLSKRRFDLPRGDGFKGQEALLADECKYTEILRRIEREIRNDGDHWKHLSREELVRHIADLAEAHYYSLWSLCNDEERLVLIHLAEDGFVNRRSWEIVRRLMRRGLVRRRPALRPMNESFERFVREVEAPRQVREWEHAAGASTYDRVRALLAVTFAGIGALLLLTQPDLLKQGIGALSAIVGGTGLIMQLLGYLQTNPRPMERASAD
jgi:hypothetical protein